ncbi:MAG: ribonuclease HII [Methanotrichaceae archaeon]|nr:ribonuclease HII [Methanotrichaceae archaeon]
MALLLGVDEAGKGPVIGSMFVAGVVVEEEKLFDLAAMGVKDSKLLSANRRDILASRICNLSDDHYVLEVKASVIDELRQIMTMNEIMVRAHSQVVQRLKADKGILDAADVDERRFCRRVCEDSGTSIDLVAEHKADRNHLIVAAASIVAKHRRDRSIRDLEQRAGAIIGSGYPSDPKTIRFIEGWIKEHGVLPACTRKTWATAQRLIGSSV